MTCWSSAAGVGGAGDPRLSDADREILRRITTGDLVGEFQAALEADVESHPLLGGHDNND
jgi:hypothetical protein